MQLCTRPNLVGEDALRFQELALDKHLNINCIGFNGRTPLLLLCSFNQNKDLCRYLKILLKRSTMDINWKDKNNCNALLNLSLHHRGNPLLKMFRLLIGRGIDLNCCNDKKWNVLRILCVTYNGNDLIEIIRLLVQHNAKDDKGWAAHFLLMRGFTPESEVIHILKRAFIDEQK